MELRNLKTFLAVARRASFKGAAAQLNYAQSSVSAQIKVLEEEIGKPLFVRSAKSVTLSPAGQALIRYAQKIVDMEKEAAAALSSVGEPRGSISLRIPQTLGTYYMPGVLQDFRQSHPRVDFDISSCEYQMLPDELAAGVTDLAFLMADSVDFSVLKTEFLGTLRLVLAGPPGHALAGDRAVATADLDGEPMIFAKHDCSYRMHFTQRLAEEKAGPGAVIEMNSVEAIKRCVAGGLGITLIPEIAVLDEIRTGKLAVLPWAEDPLETAVLMIWHKEKWLSPLLRGFMDTVRGRFFPR